jgi:hypothetical protein
MHRNRVNFPPGLDTSWSDGRDRTRTCHAAAEENDGQPVPPLQIAEGTLRALRDMALDEAVELHQHPLWSDRWERPILSWLERVPGM